MSKNLPISFISISFKKTVLIYCLFSHKTDHADNSMLLCLLLRRYGLNYLESNRKILKILVCC